MKKFKKSKILVLLSSILFLNLYRGGYHEQIGTGKFFYLPPQSHLITNVYHNDNTK